MFAWFALFAATGLISAAADVSDIRLWSRPVSPEDVCAVKTVAGVPYVSGASRDVRHALDIYLPEGRKNFPVVVFVHGGAWTVGDKHLFGLYGGVGEFLASQGIGAVLPNYRLSPRVKHPEHVRDVAKAVAWTRNHIAEYGGDPHQMFLAGHSAGAHLVSLLATDEQYLDAEGLRPSDIRGVIAVSGVYRIRDGAVSVTLGGQQPEAFRMDEFFPFRTAKEELPGISTSAFPLPLKFDPFAGAFAPDAESRALASPVTHVKPGLPPFLVLAAERDLPTLGQLADEFSHALLRVGCQARFETIPGRNHNSVIFRAITPDDPVAIRMLSFVRSHTK